jgi:hypothetical protein
VDGPTHSFFTTPRSADDLVADQRSIAVSVPERLGDRVFSIAARDNSDSRTIPARPRPGHYEKTFLTVTGHAVNSEFSQSVALGVPAATNRASPTGRAFRTIWKVVHEQL